jgi:integrase
MTARHHLTDKQLANAKRASKGKRYILWDSLTPSLGVRITERGHKSFLIQRRVNGRMVKLTIGEYPALGLASAREKALEALREMERGIDPRQSKPPSVTATGLRRDSFEGAVESYIKRQVEKNLGLRTQQEVTRTLRKVLVPQWGTLPVRDIGPRQIVEALDTFMDADKPIMANRTYSILHRFFNWCIERHLIDTNPAARVRKPAKETTRARVLDDDELRAVWLACESLGWPFGPMFRLLILTGQRRNEVAGMCWNEIDDATGLWTIPAFRTKNRREHVVPLPLSAIAQLRGTPRFVGALDKPPGYVFTTTGKTAVSGFSRAKSKLDTEAAKTRVQQVSEGVPPRGSKGGIPPWTVHDLRRTCATGMGALGVPPHIIETVLNHSSGFRAGVAGVYQRQAYMDERRQALNAWADHVMALSGPRAPSRNVIAFQRVR